MTLKRAEDVFEIQFACELSKLVSGSNAPLIAENGLDVTLGFIVAYAHEKINILVSVLNIIFFLFYDDHLNTQDFVYFEFVKYQLGIRRNMSVFLRNAMYAYLLYVQIVFLCQKKVYLSDCRVSKIFILEPVLTPPFLQPFRFLLFIY